MKLISVFLIDGKGFNMAYKNREVMLAKMKEYYQKNKPKFIAAAEKWRKEHPEYTAERARKWRKKNPDKARSAQFKYKYGITLDEYKLLLVGQNNVCAICKKPSYRNLAVDHCHNSERVRGLLCDPCNVSLGLLREDIQVIKNMINYLEDKE